MQHIPLLTQNMDMTLEFFFTQKSSLYVISDEHYTQFKREVFQYAPLLTTIEKVYFKSSMNGLKGQHKLTVLSLPLAP